MSNWDGVWYWRIAKEGYDYSPSRHSSVAFFPGLPVLAMLLHRLLGLPPELGLLLVSSVSMIATLCVLQLYVQGDDQHQECLSHSWALLSLCLWPTGLFLRMGYSEALFLILLVTAMYGIQKSWPVWIVAVIAGCATGTRAVGVALLFPLTFALYRRAPSLSLFVWKTILYSAVSCWALFVYMIYQAWVFGDALAFSKTQQHWTARPNPIWPYNCLGLLTAEPLWTIYLETSPAYWGHHEYVPNALFSLQFWNPIYFATCAGLVAYGAWKKWLTPPEWLLSVGLLGIPYVMQSYRMMMLGHGRFTCVVFPMYIVLGRLMAKWPAPVTTIVCTLMGIQLFYWSALFAAWHRVF